MHRFPTRCTAAGFAALLLSAASLLSQEHEQAASAPRFARILGQVMDRDGKPVEGANVRVWHLPHAGAQAIGPRAELRARRTNQLGRFIVRAPRGFSYCAQAEWTDAQGKLHASVVLENLVPGMRVRMPEGRALDGTSLRIDEIEDAQEIAEELKVRIAVACEHPRTLHEARTTRAALERGIELPALASRIDGRVRVAIEDSKGALLFAERAPRGGALRFPVHRAAPLQLRILDRRGKALAGVIVEKVVLADRYWRPVATRRIARSGADGHADVPRIHIGSKDEASSLYLVKHPKHAFGILQIYKDTMIVNGARRKDALSDGKRIDVRLTRAVPLKIHVRNGDQALAHAKLELRWMAAGSSGAGGRTSSPMPPLVAALDEAGRYVWDGLPSRVHDLQIVAHLDPAKKHAGEGTLTILSTVDRRFGLPDRVEVDLQKRAPLALRIFSSSKRVVEGARIAFADARGSMISPHVSDIRGRIACKIPPYATHVSVWHGGDGARIAELSKLLAGDAPERELTLRPYDTREITVRRPKNESCAGIGFRIASMTSPGDRRAYTNALTRVFSQQLAATRTNENGSCLFRYPSCPQMDFLFTCLHLSTGTRIARAKFETAAGLPPLEIDAQR